jgi:hypothetical protein
MIPHVLASNGDLALKNSVHLPKQKSLGLRCGSLNGPEVDGYRNTSGWVAKDGILPANLQTFPVLFRFI